MAEESVAERPRNPYLIPLQLVGGAYFPFLGGVILVSAALAALALSPWDGWRGHRPILLGIALTLTCAHLVLGLCTLLRRVDERDEFEVELPDKSQRGLAKLVGRVAADRELDPPDVIRLHASSVAHVYLDRDGQSVLVVGGPLIGMVPQHSLAGIVAHELSHFTAGDAARSRTAWHWHRVMGNLEVRFLTHKWALWNPLVWPIRLYHHVYFRLLFASSRRQEFLADSYEVDQVGAEDAAATLVLFHLLEHLPWANLGAMVERMAMANHRVDDLFAEQVRGLRATSRADWEEALREALRERTKWDATHPCLKDRLKPLGVKAKDVLPLAMNLAGEPSTALFADWPAVEKRLSKKLQAFARVRFAARQQTFEDIAAIVKSS